MTSQRKTAAITGGSSGIGFAIAKSLHGQGWNILINGRDSGKLEAAAQALGAPDRVATVVGNIGDAATGKHIAETAQQRFGRIDLLVNNAGTFGIKPFLDVGEEEIDHYLNGNLKGTYLTTQAVVRQMKEQGNGGSIVNIGTVLIDHAAAGVPASAALISKGGVHALTRNLAAELAVDGIRVNLVAPGMIRTPLQSGNDPKALASVALANRIGEADEIADAVAYLAGADFVTGHTLNVDGGFVSARA